MGIILVLALVHSMMFLDDFLDLYESSGPGNHGAFIVGVKCACDDRYFFENYRSVILTRGFVIS